MTLSAKLELLKDILSKMGSVLVAYSGGVDSTFLLKIAGDVLKDPAHKSMCWAVTASSEIYSARELKQAEKNANMLGMKHIIISTSQLDDPKFTSNTPKRCYYCKRELFSKLLALAKQYGLNYVTDGSNYDDAMDFRPGMRAQPLSLV